MKLAVLYAGQGAQHPGMGKEFYEASPASATVTFSTWRRSSGGGSSSSSGSSYAVSVPNTKNGDVTVSPETAKKGDTVTITVTPDKGYELDTIAVKDANGNTVKLTDKGNGKYTFTMPGSKMTVSAEFVEEQVASTFADVPTDAYYAKAVEWAVENGITNGKAKGLCGLHSRPDRDLPVARRRFPGPQGDCHGSYRCPPRQLLLQCRGVGH